MLTILRRPTGKGAAMITTPDDVRPSQRLRRRIGLVLPELAAVSI